MEIRELKEAKIVAKDAHFRPIVELLVGAIVGTLSNQVGKQLKRNIDFSHLNVFNKNRVYTPINYGEEEVASLTMSIDDIKY